MEFTKEMKEKINSFKSEEEAKKFIEETKKNVEKAGFVLDDDDLDKAAGGKYKWWPW